MIIRKKVSFAEEFTFLRPNGGWIDVYKATFERMYQQSLEGAVLGTLENLSGEAMLDDFEYMLIRPYVNERKEEIKHKPYAAMDRIARLEYLDGITKKAPKNRVERSMEKYKNGELSLKQIKSAQGIRNAERAQYLEFAGCVQAVERVNQSRSTLWKALHPLKNNAEQRDVAQMKRTLIEEVKGENFYNEMVSSAYETFDGYQRVTANLTESMARAREEINRLQRMNEVMRESLHVEGFDNEPKLERSPQIDPYIAPVREKQI